ncbi:MAG TPA: glycerophosphodiester phosphodiesterase [Acidimicrobiales bacterium]|nr:glycerophosphodiester phosphodiesterase [Acidimicrobiales bacterium]MDP6240872.1 glycerophosphodiester phosphodiesterase [Acidimicrobiales bacterium]MDP7123851.1 glycerophosphodiester phosphodiesterase [Acidimicrobiales bacterium]MDP7352991.1 glycerophosphodiester phosphodiesterase [Acidimicrobiales bacterium]MDP7508367.1 glycerophosphodiester phosphodiesterase [Acidimicrobiales bacterium]
MPGHMFLDHPGVLAFAHRGGAEEVPENSLAAFRHAVDLGYRYLETDVHLTADGVLVAFHDDVLDRVTDSTGRLADLSWDEVSTARIAGTEPIPTLTELLEAFPDARINIDAKADAVVPALSRILLEFEALDRVCLGAFSDSRLKRLRDLLGPELCTSAGPRSVAGFRVASLGLPMRQPPWHCLQVPVSSNGVRLVDHRFVRAADDRGLQVHVWTINDAEEMHRLLDIGVHGIMTDRPGTLRTVLLDRGLWA